MLPSFAKMASLMVLMATIPATAAQPTNELADSLAGQTDPDPAAQRWALAVFAQLPGPASCPFAANRQTDSGEQGSGCKRFVPGPKSFTFNGGGKFKLSVCPGGLGGNECDDRACVVHDDTGLIPCTRMSGFEFYQVR